KRVMLAIPTTCLAGGKFFASNENNENGDAIMVRPADLSAQPRPAIAGDKLLFYGGGLTSWSPDGKYFVSWGGRPSHVWTMSATHPAIGELTARISFYELAF